LLTLFIFPLLRGCGRGTNAYLFDVTRLPALLAPMLSLATIKILGNTRMDNLVAQLEVVPVDGSAGSHRMPAYATSLRNRIQYFADGPKS